MNSEIPSATTRQAALKQLREANRSLELTTLALEDLLAMIEADLRRQKRERLTPRKSI